jgi:uncharacterized protein YggU (UPF0235/DUF167 family)
MIIKIKVKPGVKEEKIEKVGEEYIICVKEPAKDNKANVAVLKILSKHFNINYKKIKIVNPTSRNKIVKIEI